MDLAVISALIYTELGKAERDIYTGLAQCNHIFIGCCFCFGQTNCKCIIASVTISCIAPFQSAH